MKPIKFITLLLLFASMFFIFTSCIKPEKEDYYAKTYYDVVGEGYVFMYDVSSSTLLYPIQDAKISIVTVLDGDDGGWIGPPRPRESFITECK